MARPRTDFRNELKTRVTDPVYDALQTYIQANRCASEARAISELLELALLGTVGSIPQDVVHCSPGLAQIGPKTHA
jgi:hypothetical protein